MILCTVIPDGEIRGYAFSTYSIGDLDERAIAVIYMHAMHAWLTVQMLWQMHGRTLQAVHMLIVCMGIF